MLGQVYSSFILWLLKLDFWWLSDPCVILSAWWKREHWEFFGLCFPVFLSQDSWSDILLTCRSLLSQGFKDDPLHTSWAFFSLYGFLLPAFGHADVSLLSLPECPSLSLSCCCVETAFRQLSGGSLRIYVICVPVLPIILGLKTVFLCIFYLIV